jgi:hypothetical protein
MAIRTRVQRWEKAGVLPDILEAAAPATARIKSAYWSYLRYLSFGPGWKFNRPKDDPEFANLPRQTRCR